MTRRQLTTDPSTGRICTTCSQRLRTYILTQHHYDLNVHGDKHERNQQTPATFLHRLMLNPSWHFAQRL
jgi:hypothetical protein